MVRGSFWTWGSPEKSWGPTQASRCSHMRAEHFEILVEEPSMEAFLTELLPRVFGDRATFMVYTHQGKPDLLRKLTYRLRAYSRWLPANYRIVVITDLDRDECAVLKRR